MDEKTREEAVNLKIRLLREKSKSIEMRHKLVEEDKRHAEQRGNAVSSRQTIDRQTKAAKSNSRAHMDEAYEDDYQNDAYNEPKDFRQKPRENRDYSNNYGQGDASFTRSRGSRQQGPRHGNTGRSPGDHQHQRQFSDKNPEYRHDFEDSRSQQSGYHSRGFSRSKQFSSSSTHQQQQRGNRYNDEQNAYDRKAVEREQQRKYNIELMDAQLSGKLQKGDENWQDTGGFLQDSRREGEGEFSKRPPPRNVRFNPNDNRSRPNRNQGGNPRMDRMIDMTGRQRQDYDRWKQQQEEADKERLARSQAESGKWRRDWDNDKNLDFDDDSRDDKRERRGGYDRRGGGGGNSRYPPRDFDRKSDQYQGRGNEDRRNDNRSSHRSRDYDEQESDGLDPFPPLGSKRVVRRDSAEREHVERSPGQNWSEEERKVRDDGGNGNRNRANARLRENRSREFNARKDSTQRVNEVSNDWGEDVDANVVDNQKRGQDIHSNRRSHRHSKDKEDFGEEPEAAWGEESTESRHSIKHESKWGRDEATDRSYQNQGQNRRNDRPQQDREQRSEKPTQSQGQGYQIDRSGQDPNFQSNRQYQNQDQRDDKSYHNRRQGWKNERPPQNRDRRNNRPYQNQGPDRRNDRSHQNQDRRTNRSYQNQDGQSDGSFQNRGQDQRNRRDERPRQDNRSRYQNRRNDFPPVGNQESDDRGVDSAKEWNTEEDWGKEAEQVPKSETQETNPGVSPSEEQTQRLEIATPGSIPDSVQGTESLKSRDLLPSDAVFEPKRSDSEKSKMNKSKVNLKVDIKPEQGQNRATQDGVSTKRSSLTSPLKTPENFVPVGDWALEVEMSSPTYEEKEQCPLDPIKEGTDNQTNPDVDGVKEAASEDVANNVGDDENTMIDDSAPLLDLVTPDDGDMDKEKMYCQHGDDDNRSSAGDESSDFEKNENDDKDDESNQEKSDDDDDGNDDDSFSTCESGHYKESVEYQRLVEEQDSENGLSLHEEVQLAVSSQNPDDGNDLPHEDTKPSDNLSQDFGDFLPEDPSANKDSQNESSSKDPQLNQSFEHDSSTEDLPPKDAESEKDIDHSSDPEKFKSDKQLDQESIPKDSVSLTEGVEPDKDLEDDSTPKDSSSLTEDSQPSKDLEPESSFKDLPCSDNSNNSNHETEVGKLEDAGDGQLTMSEIEHLENAPINEKDADEEEEQSDETSWNDAVESLNDESKNTVDEKVDDKATESSVHEVTDAQIQNGNTFSTEGDEKDEITDQGVDKTESSDDSPNNNAIKEQESKQDTNTVQGDDASELKPEELPAADGDEKMSDQVSETVSADDSTQV